MLKRICDRYNVFYGWVIVACGILIMMAAYGIGGNCFSLFVKPVTEEFGFTRQGFNVCLMLGNLVNMLISLVAGKIFKKIKVHTLMKISSIVLPAAYFGYSLCSELWMFYVMATIVGITRSLLTFLPFALIIANWFEEKRGLAIGLTFMGSGAGGMLFGYLGGGWMESFGWRQTAILQALCIAVVVIPTVFLVLRVHPQEMGLAPNGAKKAGPVQKAAAPVYGMEFTSALRTVSFWAAVGFTFLISFASVTLSSNVVPHLSDIGFSERYASTIMSLFMGGVAICKVLLGGMYDKLGMKKTTAIAGFAMAVGLTGLILGANPWAHVLVVLGTSLGCAVSTVVQPILTQNAFGTRAYTSIYGIMSAAGSLSSSVAPLFFGAVYDNTGSYNGALYAAIGLVALSLMLMAIIKPCAADRR